MRPFLFNRVGDDEILERCKKMHLPMIDSPYSYKGYKVPRVTSVLSDMLSEEYLITWANNVGLFQRKKHTYYRNKATTIGSAVHNAIQERIQFEIETPNFENIKAQKDRLAAIQSYNAFNSWWNIVESKSRVILEEYTLITEYCGGTLDLLININGKLYLLDFKTSMQISFKYYVQLAAYRRMLYDIMGYIVDGVIILRLDKKNGKFEESVLDFYVYDDLLFIEQCDSLFISILYGYYCRANVEASKFIKGGMVK